MTKYLYQISQINEIFSSHLSWSWICFQCQWYTSLQPHKCIIVWRRILKNHKPYNFMFVCLLSNSFLFKDRCDWIIFMFVVKVVVDAVGVANNFATNSDCQEIYDRHNVSHSQNSWSSSFPQQTLQDKLTNYFLKSSG